MKHIILTILAALIITGCGDDTIPPGNSGPLSDLTRTGKFISFTSNLLGNLDIYLVQVTSDGVLDTNTANLIYATNPHNLTQSNTTDDKQSNWSPDGRVLVFARTNGNVQEIYAFFFNADGSIDPGVAPNPRQLFSSDTCWDNNPSFSPDGARLIWDRRYDNNSPAGVDLADSRDLMIGDVSGTGNNFQVQNIRKILFTVPGDEYNPKWSPRISVGRVAYEYQTSATATDHDVWIIDPNNSSNNVNFYNPNNSGYPAWAPACDRIIFESDKSTADFWKIVSLSYPTNNGQPADVAAEANIHLRYPTWLPNGGLISYIKFTGTNGNIWIIPSGGGAAFKLLQLRPQFDAANNLWPAW